jgi:hypothetical protein
MVVKRGFMAAHKDLTVERLKAYITIITTS